MSHRPYTATVPFKLSHPYAFDEETETDEDEENEEVEMLPEAVGFPKELRDLYRAMMQFMDMGANPAEVGVGGWSIIFPHTLSADMGVEIDTTLMVIQFVKDTHTVYYVNESQYSNVGYETPVFISKSKDALVCLQADLKWDGSSIEENCLVTCWY